MTGSTTGSGRLSLAALRALPAGALVSDRVGRVWRRQADGKAPWWRDDLAGVACSTMTLLDFNGPIFLAVGQAPAAAAAAGSA